jgi:hypothetical protein
MWPAGAIFAVMPGGWLYLEKTKYDEAFEAYLLPVFDWKNQIINPEAARRSDEAITNITQQTPAKRLVRHQFFLAMLLPALTRTCQKTAFSQTAVQTATVACAIERYRLEKGKLPSTLEALVPGYIPTLPHDIINGKPLTYRTETDDRYALYSVGWNEQDDGGVVHHSNSGEADQKEGDWVWASIFEH